MDVVSFYAYDAWGARSSGLAIRAATSVRQPARRPDRLPISRAHAQGLLPRPRSQMPIAPLTVDRRHRIAATASSIASPPSAGTSRTSTSCGRAQPRGNVSHCALAKRTPRIRLRRSAGVAPWRGEVAAGPPRGWVNRPPGRRGSGSRVARRRGSSAPGAAACAASPAFRRCAAPGRLACDSAMRLTSALARRRLRHSPSSAVDLLDREAEVARTPDEAQRVHRRLVVLAVAARRCAAPWAAGRAPRSGGSSWPTWRWRARPDRCSSQRLLRHVARPPALEQQRVAHHADAADSAIAAPAITGLSKPSAASGMPTTL